MIERGDWCDLRGAVGVVVTRAASMAATRVQIRAEQQQLCVFQEKTLSPLHLPIMGKQLLNSLKKISFPLLEKKDIKSCLQVVSSGCSGFPTQYIRTRRATDYVHSYKYSL